MTRALILALLLSVSLQDDLPKKIDEIIPRLSDDSIDVRDKAVQALADLGPAAVPLLKKRAAELGAETQGRLLEAVGRIESRNTLGKYLPPLKRVTMDWENKPARDALDEISRRTGITVDASGAGIDGAVTFALKEAGPIEAFDELCRRAGLSWRPANDDLLGRRRGNVPRDTPRIMVHNGKAIEYPTTYVRHYRIRVTQVSLTRTNNFQLNQSNAQMNLDLAWTPDVKPDGLNAFKITELRDEQGRSLLPEENDRVRGRFRNTARSRYRNRDMGNSSQYLAFKFPEADAKKIAVLKGTASFSFPQEVKTLVFGKPSESQGKAIELNGLTITLKDYQEKANARSLTLEITGRFNGPKDDTGDDDEFNMPFTYEDVELVSETGEAVRHQGMSGRGDGKSYTWQLDYEGEKGEKGSGPKEVRIFAVLRRFTDEAAFEIKDIALPK